MTFIYDKKINGRTYRYEIEAYRDPKTGKPKQRIVAYHGRVRIEGGKKVLDPKRSVRPEVEEILPFGDLALIYDTASRLDFVHTVDRFAPRSGTSAGEALLLLVMNHLTGRIALDGISEWYDRSALRYWMEEPEESFSEDSLLGVLDSVCKQEDDLMRDKTFMISEAFRKSVEETWGPGSRYVYYDRTQIVYNGSKSWYAEFSYPQSQRDRRKIGMGVVVRRGDGFPVLYRIYRGNRVDVTTVDEIRNRLSTSGMRDLIVVMDRGMSSDENIIGLRKAGYHVIAGVSTNEKVFYRTVSSVTEEEMQIPGNAIVTPGGIIFAAERTFQGRKYVAYQDPKTRAENIASFVRALEEGKEKMSGFALKQRGRKSSPDKKIRKLLNGMYGYFQWSLSYGKLLFSVKEDAVREAMVGMGRSVIVCTDPGIAREDIIRAYLEKDEVEKVWRIGKGSLGFSAIKHWRRDRVAAYLFVCYLSYLVWITIRVRLRENKFDLSPEKALSILRRVEMVRFRSSGREYHEFPKPVGMEEKLQKAFNLTNLKEAVMVK